MELRWLHAVLFSHQRRANGADIFVIPGAIGPFQQEHGDMYKKTCRNKNLFRHGKKDALPTDTKTVSQGLKQRSSQHVSLFLFMT